MKLQELTKMQRAKIYNEYLINDFHKSEVEPLEIIEGLIDRGHYKCYGFYEDKDLLGYAYFIKTKDSILMDYLVINPNYRCKGLGSKFIEIIKDKFKAEFSSLLAEVENPKHSLDDIDKCNRERRIQFYLKNNFNISNIESCVYKDQYSIINLKLKEQLTDEKIYKEVEKIYKIIFGETIFKEQISISVL